MEPPNSLVIPSAFFLVRGICCFIHRKDKQSEITVIARFESVAHYQVGVISNARVFTSGRRDLPLNRPDT
jgi:hypothetical protein